MKESGETSLWKRQDEAHSNETKLHNFCAPYIERDAFHQAHLTKATFHQQPDTENKPEELRFFATVPQVRTGLKNSPLVIFGVYLFLLLYAEIVPNVNGISRLLPSFTFEQLLAILGVCLIVVLLFIFFAWILIEDIDETHSIYMWCILRDVLRPLLFYTGLIILGVGTIASLFLTTISGVIEPNIVFTSGFLLLLYITGPIVYDGMLRTERLFNNLDELDIIAVQTPTESDIDCSVEIPSPTLWDQEFYRTSVKAINSTQRIILMACLFVLPFSIIWFGGDGPFHTGSALVTAIASVLDILIAALCIQFLILNRILYTLLTSSENDSVHLQYISRHPDTTAGYGDFGRFASRVNILLLIAVVYLIHRLFVHGRLPFLLAGETFSLKKITPLWAIDFLLPVAATLFVIFVWFYFSFWLMHSAMQRERQRRLTELPADIDGNITVDHKYIVLRDGPVWPINQKLLVALLSADLVSFTVALFAVFL